MIGSDETLGLRARKRRHTRGALVDAAVRLCAEYGYAGTTVEQIAEACDVSGRTFFRYFGAKEDALLAALDEVDVYFLDVFMARPNEESIATSFAAAVAATWGRDWSSESMAQRLQVARIVSADSGLAAADLRRGTRHEQRLVRAVAHRLATTSVPPALDPPVHRTAALIVAALASSVRVAWGEWLELSRSGGDAEGPGAARRLFLDCLEQMLPALRAAERSSGA